MTSENKAACPACGNSATRFVTHPLLKGEMRRCTRCGLIFIDPPWTTERAAQALAEAEGALGSVAHGYSDRRPALRWMAGLLAQALPSGGALLDVGCANGVFFEALRGSGVPWQLNGVELDTAWQTNDYKGAQVHFKALRACTFPDGHFDAVSVLDALYYFPDLAQELAEIRRILKPNGVFLFDVPGIFYLRLRGFAGRFLGLSHTRTFSAYPYYFSSAALRSLLLRAGFRIERALPDRGIRHGNPALRMAQNAYTGAAQTLARAIPDAISLAPKVIYICRAAGEAMS